MKLVSNAPNRTKEGETGVPKSESLPWININKHEVRRHIRTDRKKC